MFQKILEEIKKYQTIIIHRHTNPDGDAIGSQVGLKLILKENFPSKNVYIVGDSPKRYSFIDGSTPEEIDDSAYNGALAVVLDTSAKSLISDLRYTYADKTVRFDHHIFCEEICDLELYDTSYESCCGLIADFAIKNDLRVPVLAGKALYTGMITDSGRFRYDSTNAQTFRIASFLISLGFDTTDIYRNLYSDDFSTIRLRASFVLKIKFTENNVAYIYNTLEEVSETGADTFTVSRGMVSTMSEIKGVDIWVNFTETENGVLAELRSSKYNINQIAVKYGGGGHLKASGTTLKNKDEAMKMLNDLNALALS